MKTNLGWPCGAEQNPIVDGRTGIVVQLILENIYAKGLNVQLENHRLIVSEYIPGSVVLHLIVVQNVLEI